MLGSSLRFEIDRLLSDVRLMMGEWGGHKAKEHGASMDEGEDEIESALDQLFKAYDLDELGPVLTDWCTYQSKFVLLYNLQ